MQHPRVKIIERNWPRRTPLPCSLSASACSCALVQGPRARLDAEQTGVPEERARTVAALYRSIGEHDDNSRATRGARTLEDWEAGGRGARRFVRAKTKQAFAEAMPRPWTGSILIWLFSPKVPRPRRTAAISDAPQHEGRGKFRGIMHSKDLGEGDIATGINLCLLAKEWYIHQARRHEGE